MTVRAVHHLNCATMRPTPGWLVGTPAWRGRMVAHCLLIETARDGLVLVDSGFGTRETDDPAATPAAFRRLLAPALDRAETALAQVEARGFSAADVRHVVVTHLDLDHAGGLADFPRARVHLHAREHAAATTRTTWRERARYIPRQWAHGPAWQLYREEGDTWRGLPAVGKLAGLDADLALVPLHGHSRGHTGVVVRAPDGRWLVHAGDAYFHHHALDGRTVPLGLAAFERGAATDGRGRVASLEALRRLGREPDVTVFCAHDAAELDRLRAPTARPASRT